MIEITRIKFVVDSYPKYAEVSDEVLEAVRRRMKEISQERLRWMLETGGSDPFQTGDFVGRLFLDEILHKPD